MIERSMRLTSKGKAHRSLLHILKQKQVTLSVSTKFSITKQTVVASVSVI